MLTFGEVLRACFVPGHSISVCLCVCACVCWCARALPVLQLCTGPPCFFHYEYRITALHAALSMRFLEILIGCFVFVSIQRCVPCSVSDAIRVCINRQAKSFRRGVELMSKEPDGCKMKTREKNDLIPMTMCGVHLLQRGAA